MEPTPLSESEYKYRRLFEDSRDAMVIASADRAVLDVNQAALDLFGYTQEEMVGMDPWDLMADHEMAQHVREIILETGFTKDLDVKCLKKDGTLLDCIISSTALKGATGVLKGFQGIFKDVTERRRSERELQRRTDQLEAQFEIANILVQGESYSEKISRMLEVVVRIAEGNLAMLRVPDEGGSGLRLVSWAGETYLQAPPAEVLGFDRGMAGLCYHSGKTVVINDYAAHERAIPWVVEAGLKSMAVFPIKVSEKVLGTLNVDSWEVDHFNPEIVRHLTAVAGGIGAILEDSRLQEAERLRRRELEALFAIARLLLQPIDFKQKNTRLLKILSRVVEADRATMRLVDDQEGGFRLAAIAGKFFAKLSPPELIPFGDVRLVGKVFSSGNTVVISTSENHPEMANFVTQMGLESFIGLPIKSGNRVLGIACLASTNAHHFRPDRIRILTAITNEVGALLEVTRLVEADRQRSLELQALLNISEVVVSTSGFHEGVVKLLETVVDIVEADRANLYLIEQNKNEMRFIANVGPTSKQVDPPSRISIEYGISGLAVRKGQVVVTNNYPSHPAAVLELVNAGLKSSVALPVRSGGRISGLLAVNSWKRDHFTSKRVRLLASIAGGMGAHLERANLHQMIASQLEEGRRRLETFKTVATGLSLEGDTDLAMKHLVDASREVVGAQYGAMALWNSQEEIEKWVVSGISEEDERCISGPPKGLGVLGLLKRRASYQLKDLSIHPIAVGFPPNHPQMKSFLGVRFSSKDGRIGTLYLADKIGEADFSDDDERILNLFSVLAGVLLKNAELYGMLDKERRTLSAIQESMTEGLAVIDAAGHIRYINEAALSLCGIPLAELTGIPIWDSIDRMTGGLEATEQGNRIAAILAGETNLPATVEFAITSPHRRELVMTAFSILASEEEELTGLLLRDITHQRDLERRRDNFVSIASHELRTPMAVVGGFADLLLKGDLPQSTQKEGLQVILENVKTLTTIMNDLLDVSKIQSGQYAIRSEAVIVADILEGVSKNYGLLSDKHEIVVVTPSGLPKVIADRDRVYQVVSNLVMNAVKYSPRGGKVTVSAVHKPETGQVVVSVADQGIGISAEDQERLFTTFYRIKRPETEDISGSGLGLFIVKELVGLMGGEVWVESQLNRGSTFSVALPINGEIRGESNEKKSARSRRQ